MMFDVRFLLYSPRSNGGSSCGSTDKASGPNTRRIATDCVSNLEQAIIGVLSADERDPPTLLVIAGQLHVVRIASRHAVDETWLRGCLNNGIGEAAVASDDVYLSICVDVALSIIEWASWEI